ncbi:MAG: PAS domain S-box protein, partial [Pseudomonadota bacterium]|nr:PAS domain S-box protein [Pseudomonadota bacterium]
MKDLEQLAFDQAPMGLALTENRVIRSCNQSFAEMFGYEKEQLIGQSFRLLYGTDQEFHQVRDIGLAPLRQSHPYTDERIMRCADGSRIWVRFRARTLTPEDPLAQIVLSFAPIDQKPTGPSLTPREREVLMWLSRGRTSKEIAQVLELVDASGDHFFHGELKRWMRRHGQAARVGGFDDGHELLRREHLV